MKSTLMTMVLSALLLITPPSWAQQQTEELASLGQLQELAEGLGDALVRGEQGQALAELARYANASYQEPAAAPQLGPALGYELVAHNEWGESLYRIRLLEKHADRARLWTLLFYRAERHWQLAELQLSSKLTDAFAY